MKIISILLIVLNSIALPVAAQTKGNTKDQDAKKSIALKWQDTWNQPIAGGPMQVKHISGGKTQTWEAVQSVTLTPAQLAEFTGKYVCDELPGATYTLSMKDGKLLLQVRNGITVFSD